MWSLARRWLQRHGAREWLSRTCETPCQPPVGKPQRVSITDSFGASFVWSALESLRKARPRRSEFNLNTHPDDLNIEHYFNNTIRACNRTLKQGETTTSLANSVGRF